MTDYFSQKTIRQKMNFFNHIFDPKSPTQTYNPHEGQMKLHSARNRFRMAHCGSRWGKSTAAKAEGMFASLTPDTLGWVVAPTYELADVIFEDILLGWQNTRPDFIADYSKSEKTIHLTNGTRIVKKSADTPESLLARGVNWLICDEIALMKMQVWQAYLMPRLMDTHGWALFVSTPKGKGWYWELTRRAVTDPDFYSQSGATWENPKINKEELLATREQFTERYWNQEVLGMFIDDSGAVFRNIRGPGRIRGVWNSETGVVEEPIVGQAYSVGVDLGKQMDWTVITVLDSRGQVVYWERLPHGMSWPSQRARIKAVSQKYNNATCYVDSSGVGDPTVDDLFIENVPLLPVKTAVEKTFLIDALAVALEAGKVTYPDIPILLNELEIFEMQKTKLSGRISYNAPEGFHDDGVISLSLAWRGVLNIGSTIKFSAKGL